MNRIPIDELRTKLTRRHFFSHGATGIGVAALGSLLADDASTAPAKSGPREPGVPLFRPRARRVICLFQSGAPSQLETFDYKPRLRELQGSELPDSVRQGQRLTGMTSGQSSFPVPA